MNGVFLFHPFKISHCSLREIPTLCYYPTVYVSPKNKMRIFSGWSGDMSNNGQLLDIRNLKTYFHTFDGTAKAVDDVSFVMNKRETLGLVGESGCGKSVTALSIMRLIQDPPGKIVGGKILFDGVDLVKLSAPKMRQIRGNRISMIFQEPMDVPQSRLHHRPPDFRNVHHS